MIGCLVGVIVLPLGEGFWLCVAGAAAMAYIAQETGREFYKWSEAHKNEEKNK